MNLLVSLNRTSDVWKLVEAGQVLSTRFRAADGLLMDLIRL